MGRMVGHAGHGHRVVAVLLVARCQRELQLARRLLHVEEGEDHHSTAKRELLEETGIDKIRIIPSWSERTEYSYSRKGSTNRKQVYWYLATTDEFDVKLSHEHTNFLWLDIKNALNQLTFEQEKIILSDAGKVLENLSLD